MTESEFDDEWDRRITEMQSRVEELLPEGTLVLYRAYAEDEDGLPVDNLNELAVDGRCRFVQKYDPFWGKGRDFESSEVLNPSWLEVCRLADEMIRVTRDEQHVFLEGVSVLREDRGVTVVEFIMGS